jgi:hypothetical protein
MRKAATAGASDTFLQRVKGEITPAQYVRSLDRRVSERNKAEQRAKDHKQVPSDTKQ